jgi:hypothetical protein
LKYNNSTYADAALGCSLKYLQWIVENGYSTSKWVSVYSTSKENIRILEWLYENKHLINSISTVYSILNTDI